MRHVCAYVEQKGWESRPRPCGGVAMKALMNGRDAKILGLVLALLPLGIVTAKVSSRACDLPETRLSEQAQLIHAGRHRGAQNYGNLPLRFELNKGQTNARVRFLARGGYRAFLTDYRVVLSLRKSSPGINFSGKSGVTRRHELFRPVGPRARRWPSLAGGWKSPSLIPDLPQLVPDPNAGKGALWFDCSSPCPIRKTHSVSTEQSPRALRAQ